MRREKPDCENAKPPDTKPDVTAKELRQFSQMLERQLRTRKRKAVVGVFEDLSIT